MGGGRRAPRALRVVMHDRMAHPLPMIFFGLAWYGRSPYICGITTNEMSMTKASAAFAQHMEELRHNDENSYTDYLDYLYHLEREEGGAGQPRKTNQHNGDEEGI